jgi:hypothetical protein
MSTEGHSGYVAAMRRTPFLPPRVPWFGNVPAATPVQSGPKSPKIEQTPARPKPPDAPDGFAITRGHPRALARLPRTTLVRAAVTMTEYETFRHEAEAAGLTLSQWCRWMIYLGSGLPVPPSE